jgi:hypothetical protein
MDLVIDNLRLAELIAIVRQNELFFDAFVQFLVQHGYADIHSFINEPDEKKAVAVIEAYLRHAEEANLYDGIGRPYASDVAKWYFLAWTMRDAPAQRLGPLLRNVEGASLTERKAKLLNEVRKFVGPLFPESEKWTWHTISEVMLARLEGSRRALKGTTFENTVRTAIRAVIARHHLSLKVGDGQVKIGDETYDVQIIGRTRTILVPVKTRETMVEAMPICSRVTFTKQSPLHKRMDMSAYRLLLPSHGVAIWNPYRASTSYTCRLTPIRLGRRRLCFMTP